MTGDAKPTGVPEKRILAKARRLLKQRNKVLLQLGLVVGELVDLDYSFRQIGPMIGVPWQSAYRWYLKAMEEDSDSAEPDDSPESTD